MYINSLVTSLGNVEENNEQRFSGWLKQILSTYGNALVALGADAIEIGTHSLRKGVATFLSGLIGGPGAVSIFFRAGWSIGKVTMRYILEGGGGDELCGRAATCVPITSIDFANLPPHFNETNDPILTSEEWGNLVVGYDEYPKEFKEVITFLLASIVYHANWLLENLPPGHPIFTTAIFVSGTVHSLRDKVQAGCMHNDVTNMQASGIPPHILLAIQINSMKQQISELNHTVIDKLENLQSTLSTELPQLVANCVLDNCQVNGAMPITQQQIQMMFTQFQEQIMESIHTRLNQQSLLNTQINSEIEGEMDSTDFPSYIWASDNSVHPTPESFIFSNTTLQGFVNLYFIGNNSFNIKIRPYKFLRPRDIPIKKQRNIYTKCSKAFIEIKKLTNLSDNELTAMKPSERMIIFEQAFSKLYSTEMPRFRLNEAQMNLYNQSKLTLITIYDLLRNTAVDRRPRQRQRIE